MTLRLDPAHVIVFERPLTRIVKQELNLENSSSEPVAFKVKTTAPKLFCVRPNLGRIEPKSTITVQVFLQALKEEPPLDKPCKDKFLILAVPLADAVTDIPELWSRIETKEKSSISQYKLKCEYRQPPLSGVIEEELLESPVAEHRVAATTTRAGAEAEAEAAAEAAAASATGVAQETSDVLISPVNPELNSSKSNLDKVAELERQIQELKKNASREGMTSTRTAVTDVGYPVQMIIVVAILAFLAGWLLTLHRA